MRLKSQENMEQPLEQALTPVGNTSIHPFVRMGYSAVIYFLTQALFRPARFVFTKEMHVHGLENLVDSEGKALTGPSVWVAPHIHDDYFTILPEWPHVPRPPLLKALTRWPIFSVLPFCEHLHRLGSEKKKLLRKDKSLEYVSAKLGRMSAHNDRVFANCSRYLSQGYDVGMLPQGTRRTDGRNLDIKPGVFRLASMSGASCQPIGVSYDTLAGGRRSLVFLRFGKPLAYTGQDEGTYLESIRKSFLANDTVTAGGLLSDYILSSHVWDAFPGRVGVDEFVDRLEVLSGFLENGSDLHFDPALCSSEGREKRAMAFFQTLVRQGYARQLGPRDILLDRSALDEKPSPRDFRKPRKAHPLLREYSASGNPVQHHANMLYRIADVKSSGLRHKLVHYSSALNA